MSAFFTSRLITSCVLRFLGFIYLITVMAACTYASGSLPLQGTVHDVSPGGDIQSAINNAPAGDTIFFNAGTYNLKNTITLKSGQLYHGASGAILQGAYPIFFLNPNDSHNIGIDGLTFNGGTTNNGTIQLVGGSESTPGQADHIIIVNCIFENANFGPVDGALFMVNVKNSTISENTFKNMSNGAAIFSYQLDNTNISHNVCTDVFQCMSLVFQSANTTGRGVTVSYNTGTGIQRFGIEIQDNGPGGPQYTTQNLLVEGNWFKDWSTTPSPDGRLAYSIVVDAGINTIVRNNYASCGTGTSIGNCDLGIELAGTGAQAYGNYVKGFTGGAEVYEPGWVVTDNNFVGSLVASVSCTGNDCVGLFDPNGVTSSNTTIAGNTANASLPIPPKPVNPFHRKRASE